LRSRVAETEQSAIGRVGPAIQGGIHDPNFDSTSASGRSRRCETVEGFGRDVQTGGEAIQDSAAEAEQGL
jgi:hypothetical protein